MAKIIQPPQKFVIPEWIYGCRHLYGNAEAERAAAERLIMESQRTMDDTKKTTDRLLFENKKRTGKHYILCSGLVQSCVQSTVTRRIRITCSKLI